MNTNTTEKPSNQNLDLLSPANLHPGVALRPDDPTRPADDADLVSVFRPETLPTVPAGKIIAAYDLWGYDRTPKPPRTKSVLEIWKDPEAMTQFDRKFNITFRTERDMSPEEVADELGRRYGAECDQRGLDPRWTYVVEHIRLSRKGVVALVSLGT